MNILGSLTTSAVLLGIIISCTQTATVVRPMDISFLGEYSPGKLLFAETTVLRNWTEARQYCNNYNMKLVSITSIEQLGFLKNTNTSTEFWTSGREYRESPQGIVWDGTSESPKFYSMYFYTMESRWPYIICLTISPSNGIIQKRSCVSTYFTLCQT